VGAGRPRARRAYHQQFRLVAPENHRHQHQGIDAHEQQQHHVPGPGVVDVRLFRYVVGHARAVRPGQDDGGPIQRAGRPAVGR